MTAVGGGNSGGQCPCKVSEFRCSKLEHQTPDITGYKECAQIGYLKWTPESGQAPDSSKRPNQQS